MIGIKDIGTYLPTRYIDNLERARQFGEEASFVINKIGALKLPHRAINEDTSDMAVSAVRVLMERNPHLLLSDIDALVVVTQNGDGRGLPHTAAIVQNKIGAPVSLAAFDISLGCSGYVYGLYVLKGFLEASGLSNGILVTADPYSKIVSLNDRNTALLFGDAATATWIGTDPSWNLGPVTYGTDGSGADVLANREGMLHMNGRAVFNFAAMKMAPHIYKLLESANLGISDVDLYCLHQGSKSIIDAITRRFPEVSERFINDMSKTGNTVSSSIPLLLSGHVLESSHETVLISGFGVGLSWATALLKKVNKEDI